MKRSWTLICNNPWPLRIYPNTEVHSGCGNDPEYSLDNSRVSASWAFAWFLKGFSVFEFKPAVQAGVWVNG